MGNQPAAQKNMYVGLFGGHGHACLPSMSNQIGTNRIPLMRTIELKGQNEALTYPGVRLRMKYLIFTKKKSKFLKK